MGIVKVASRGVVVCGAVPRPGYPPRKHFEPVEAFDWIYACDGCGVLGIVLVSRLGQVLDSGQVDDWPLFDYITACCPDCDPDELDEATHFRDA